jgi:DNA repair protein RadC
MAKRINVFSVKLVKEKGGLYNLDSKKINSPESAVEIVNEVLDLKHKPNEHFVVFTLTTKNEVAGVHTIHIGSLNASIVHPREVFQQAILNNAASIICFHNHPSSDVTPSKEDIEVTKRLKEAGKVLGIELLDHIIVGNGFTSLKEKGYI